MKKRVFLAALLLLVVATLGASSDEPRSMPSRFKNARYVYVSALDGGQFSADVLPDDRAAISRVESAIRKWGQLMLVIRPQEADVIVSVQTRPSEDVLAVYDAHQMNAAGNSRNYLWRVMGKGGLQKDMPFVLQFEEAWEKMGK
jgi:hypothetical protein